ncbi:hypothetical protein TcWFU_006007 [Taenia crassiceps]|uniref:Uncharacterized protein n=1 Tax=Taenia crassiceps TaxID=6207 RepID=A0ABR4Q049_9CEST
MFNVQKDIEELLNIDSVKVARYAFARETRFPPNLRFRICLSCLKLATPSCQLNAMGVEALHADKCVA